jgi:signal transduction histidine kinase
MKANNQNEATPASPLDENSPREQHMAALAPTPALPGFSADSPSAENCCRTTNVREDELTRTGYRRLTQSWNLRKELAAYRFSMKTGQGQEQLRRAHVGITNPRANNFSRPLTSLGAPSRNQALLSARSSEGSAPDLNPASHLRQIVETTFCSAVIEERNRMAREIHDTLAQEFAGILLHLEAVNGLGASENASDCLARARELAKRGLEDARRMLLGLRPKALEGTHLSDALHQLGQRFSRDCGINCTFSASGRSHKLPQDIENELYRVAQEALCNVREHSRASAVSILLSYTSAGVVLAIKDNGKGFAMKQPEPGAHGFGVPVMCERANRLRGRMDINSGQGTGTEIRMSVPLPAKLQRKGTTNERKFNTDDRPVQSPSSGG